MPLRGRRVHPVSRARLTPHTVRGNRPGKPVQLQEYEIKYLCSRSREIFINQPILLELEAPIKICGAWPSSDYLVPYQVFDDSRCFRGYPWPIL